MLGEDTATIAAGKRHQICVACNRKHTEGRAICSCGHVLRKDMFVGQRSDSNNNNSYDDNGCHGLTRLRQKRVCASMDDSAFDLVLDKYFLEEKQLKTHSASNRPQPEKKQKKSTRRRRNVDSSKPLDVSPTIRKRRIRNISKLCQRKLDSPIQGANGPISKELLASTEEAFMFMTNPCYSALEDINQKLARQNGICRLAYS